MQNEGQGTQFGERAAAWYLVQTKPRQEFRALEHLQRQQYECFLPLLAAERVRGGRLESCVEPLFARYLFIRLNTTDSNWAPIRSTRGVSRMVAFGSRYATLPEECVEALRDAPPAPRVPLFAPGERIAITSGPFAGLDGIYQAPDGEARALILIELMSQPQKLRLAVSALRKAA